MTLKIQGHFLFMPKFDALMPDFGFFMPNSHAFMPGFACFMPNRLQRNKKDGTQGAIF
jgi:hypothetical protein